MAAVIESTSHKINHQILHVPFIKCSRSNPLWTVDIHTISYYFMSWGTLLMMTAANYLCDRHNSLVRKHFLPKCHHGIQSIPSGQKKKVTPGRNDFLTTVWNVTGDNHSRGLRHANRHGRKERPKPESWHTCLSGQCTTESGEQQEKVAEGLSRLPESLADPPTSCVSVEGWGHFLSYRDPLLLSCWLGFNSLTHCSSYRHSRL